MEERALRRGDEARLSREGFPEKLSRARRQRDPVLYVPGFLRFDFLSTTMLRRLRKRDFEVYTMRLPYLAAGDMHRSAGFLLRKMEELRVLLGVRRLSLIGQGLGGLIARYAAEAMGAKDYLGRLIMLGTPNRGSLSFYPFAPLKAARQALPGSAFLDALARAEQAMREEGARSPLVSIYTSLDLAVIPWTSCRLEGAENIRVKWLCTHMGLARSARLMGTITDLLEGEEGEEDFRDEDDDSLLRELTLALERDGNDEGDLLRRSRLLLERGYYGWAERDLSRLIRLRPDFAEAYMLRGKALRRKIKYDENPIYNHAVRDFNQVIKLKPGWAEAYYERGVCHALLNDWPDAIDSWDRALILDRDLYPAYLARGMGRRARGDIAGAVEDFSEVLRIQPDEPEALRFLADMGREPRSL